MTQPHPPTATSPTLTRLAVISPGSVPDWTRTVCPQRDIMAGPPSSPGHLPSVGADEISMTTMAHLAARSAVLVLRAGEPPGRPGSVVAAIDTSPEDATVVAAAADTAARLGATVELQHAVPLSFGERSIGIPEAESQGVRALGHAASATTERHPELAPTIRLIRSWPHEAFGAGAVGDLLVLGGPRWATTPVLGATTTAALQLAPCPVMVVPRR